MNMSQNFVNAKKNYTKLHQVLTLTFVIKLDPLFLYKVCNIKCEYVFRINLMESPSNLNCCNRHCYLFQIKFFFLTSEERKK